MLGMKVFAVVFKIYFQSQITSTGDVKSKVNVWHFNIYVVPLCASFRAVLVFKYAGVCLKH